MEDLTPDGEQQGMIVTRRQAALSIAACAVSLPAFSQPAAAPIAAPVFRVGDSWTFDLLDYTSGSKHGDFVQTIVEVAPDGLYVDGRRRNGETFSRAQFTPEFNTFSEGDHKDMAQLRFPLAAGARWDAEFRRRSLTYDLTRKAVGMETVQTGAGELACMKVESSGLWSGGRFGNNGNFDETYWYSPQAKRIVKYMSRRWAKAGVGRAIEAEDSTVLARYSLA